MTDAGNDFDFILPPFISYRTPPSVYRLAVLKKEEGFQEIIKEERPAKLLKEARRRDWEQGEYGRYLCCVSNQWIGSSASQRAMNMHSCRLFIHDHCYTSDYIPSEKHWRKTKWKCIKKHKLELFIHVFASSFVAFEESLKMLAKIIPSFEEGGLININLNNQIILYL